MLNVADCYDEFLCSYVNITNEIELKRSLVEEKPLVITENAMTSCSEQLESLFFFSCRAELRVELFLPCHIEL